MENSEKYPPPKNVLLKNFTLFRGYILRNT